MSGSSLVSLALLLHAATGIDGFAVNSSISEVKVKENEGADLPCSYSADFGPKARVEWKFQNLKGLQTYVIFDGKPTEAYSSRVSANGNNLRFPNMTRADSGVYNCEVSGNGQFGETSVTVTVLVPPSPPVCIVPSSVTTGNMTLLSCHDKDGSPPPRYKWYKDGVLLPADPSNTAAFKNATYLLNTDNGNLEFPRVTKMDSGQYYCEAFNDAGPPQRSKPQRMEVHSLP